MKKARKQKAKARAAKANGNSSDSSDASDIGNFAGAAKPSSRSQPSVGEFWVGDNGLTQHFTYSLYQMYDCRPITIA